MVFCRQQGRFWATGSFDSATLGRSTLSHVPISPCRHLNELLLAWFGYRCCYQRRRNWPITKLLLTSFALWYVLFTYLVMGWSIRFWPKQLPKRGFPETGPRWLQLLSIWCWRNQNPVYSPENNKHVDEHLRIFAIRVHSNNTVNCYYHNYLISDGWVVSVAIWQVWGPKFDPCNG